MKQAKADAQELIDGYRGEKQQDFNNTVLAAGKISNSFHSYPTQRDLYCTIARS